MTFAFFSCNIFSTCDMICPPHTGAYAHNSGGFMEKPILYRRRVIPDECILLKDDRILRCDDDVIVTSWNTLHPKGAFDHGMSAYLLKKGIKISKFLRSDGSLFCWYCDIVDYEYGTVSDTDGAPANRTSLTVVDLLADVIIEPDGFVKVADLDELAEAAERGLISAQTLHSVLLRTNGLLETIYSGEFCKLQALIEDTLDIC